MGDLVVYSCRAILRRRRSCDQARLAFRLATSERAESPYGRSATIASVAVNDAPARFRALVRDPRRTAALPQEGLAERAGVSPRSVSELERGGAHTPRRDTIALLVRALDLAG